MIRTKRLRRAPRCCRHGRHLPRILSRDDGTITGDDYGTRCYMCGAPNVVHKDRLNSYVALVAAKGRGEAM